MHVFSCARFCDLMDCTLPGSFVRGIFQARILEWAAISYSRGSSQGFYGSSDGKESACNAGDPSLIPGSERSPREAIGYSLQCSWTSLMAQRVKILPAMWETWVRSLGWEDPLEEGMATHPSQLNPTYLKNPHGERSLAGYCPWVHIESDTTEWLSTEDLPNSATEPQSLASPALAGGFFTTASPLVNSYSNIFSYQHIGNEHFIKYLTLV